MSHPVTTENTKIDTSKKTARKDWHRADIIGGLWKRGTSMERLGRKHGYAPKALSITIQRPWPKAERIIAEELGVTPQEIWPSRYYEDGAPRSGRGERGLGRHTHKSIRAARPRNVKHGGVF